MEVLQYNMEYILLKNHSQMNIVSLFPALVISKTYIVLICTLVPKDFQRSFIGRKLLLIVSVIIKGIWSMRRISLLIDFLEAPPGYSHHLCGGESPLFFERLGTLLRMSAWKS